MIEPYFPTTLEGISRHQSVSATARIEARGRKTRNGVCEELENGTGIADEGAGLSRRAAKSNATVPAWPSEDGRAVVIDFLQI